MTPKLLLSVASLLHLNPSDASVVASPSLRKDHDVAATVAAAKEEEPYTKDANRDMIKNLPGLHFEPGFEQFGGYLSVSDSRDIFYWYIESSNDPENDPVVLWTNGGPGCSGLIGMGTEHGPYVVSKNGRLSPNPFSWNRVASMLYVEQPAGVGFSYADTDDDYKVGDKRAAADNYRLIQKFFERYPERRTNDFYVASESYGGHYIPQLTKEIIDRNTDGAINFRGFLVGNPYADPFSNAVTQFEAFYSHGVLPGPTFVQWKALCTDRESYKDNQEQCDSLTGQFYELIGNGINPYALDFPVCEGDDDATAEETLVGEDGSIVSTRSRTLSLASSSQAMSLLKQTVPSFLAQNNVNDGPPFLPKKDKYRPCAGEHWHTYLNRADVQAAIHAKNCQWDQCSTKVQYSSEDINNPTIDLYKELVDISMSSDVQLDMLVFSGDDDSVCSTAGTQYWIYDLGVEAKAEDLWQVWKVNGQTAGYVTKFDLKDTGSSFTFATVHGAGHEVPAYRPSEALHLLKAFFSGKW